ncbi:MAG: Flp pilus assembly complex ATPase component TadA [Candidatus Goldbacteria bacterium]|nr:Flp pilus assembly complex ATPase component TadA [Candidatus Goldiibacteriota bacterium]HPD18185.1 ATPase, T2SS/T4P/T4SS family [Candidatus Goldiibacteriota bacterium]
MNRPKNMLIGEMLVEEGIITKEQLKDALEEQKKTGEKIGEILIRMGYISKEILWTFLGYQMGVPYINLDEITNIRQDVLKLIPEQLIRSEKLIPVNKQGKVLTVAMSDPLNFLVIDDLKATTRCEIDARLSSPDDINKLIGKYFGFKEEDSGEIAKAKVDELDDILSAPLGSKSKEESQIKISRSPYSEMMPDDEITKTKKFQERAEPDMMKQQVNAKNQSMEQQPQTPVPQPGPEPVQPSQPKIMAEPAYTPQAVMSQDTPVNTFLTNLLSEAYNAEATDIHIEPYLDKCRIRRRIDGVLYEVESPPRTLYTGMLNKLKELAQMNVNEKNTPQESKLKVRISGKEINMAVYTFPTIFGERIVLKLLRTENLILPLNKIGMEPNVLDTYKKTIRMPHGFILIAGPTNSGKATTLYSTLNEINDSAMNIFTIDDVSSNYILPGVNQAKVNRKNYGQVLGYLEEQDCDVIAVGDVYNKETAEAIFDIVASGHLVISMTRANDTVAALQSIINFGIEPYVVYANTIAVLAQRLVRKICDRCKEPYEAPADVLKTLGNESSNLILTRGRGCSNCSNTGYKGRTAVFEFLPLNDKIKELLMADEPVKKVKEEAKKLGMLTLKESAYLKVEQGITTIEEYMKIT